MSPLPKASNSQSPTSSPSSPIPTIADLVKRKKLKDIHQRRKRNQRHRRQLPTSKSLINKNVRRPLNFNKATMARRPNTRSQDKNKSNEREDSEEECKDTNEKYDETDEEFLERGRIVVAAYKAKKAAANNKSSPSNTQTATASSSSAASSTPLRRNPRRSSTETPTSYSDNSKKSTPSSTTTSSNKRKPSSSSSSSPSTQATKKRLTIKFKKKKPNEKNEVKGGVEILHQGGDKVFGYDDLELPKLPEVPTDDDEESKESLEDDEDNSEVDLKELRLDAKAAGEKIQSETHSFRCPSCEPLPNIGKWFDTHIFEYLPKKKDQPLVPDFDGYTRDELGKYVKEQVDKDEDVEECDKMDMKCVRWNVSSLVDRLKTHYNDKNWKGKCSGKAPLALRPQKKGGDRNTKKNKTK